MKAPIHEHHHCRNQDSGQPARPRGDGSGAGYRDAHPRGEHFKQDIIEAFYQGIRHKPDTTFGNVRGDVLELKDPHFHGGNFCQVILDSAWPS